MSMSQVAMSRMHGENFPDLDAIIAELDREYDGKLPEQALRAAQRHRAEITPLLIELIRQSTHAVRAGNSCAGNGQLFALFLLTEFEAKEALPAILEAVSLPGEGPFELFGDAITEYLSGILAALAVDTPGIVDELIANRALNEYVRSQAVQTYLHWVRDGRLTREEALDRLRHHLREAIANEDGDLAERLVAELVSYSPREALPEIREAFRLGLVDSMMVGMDDVDRSIAEGQAGFRKELEWCRSTGVRDTVAELSGWAAFRDENESGRAFRQPPVSATTPADDWDTDLEDEGPRPSDMTIVNTAPKVGRNEPCPCGSGKKYKKCCGAG